ncbi:hypothetical protein BLA29_013101, partial [Euroglyphus maynei]
MTGQPDGTTLLDGQVTVNSGTGGHHLCSSSMMNNNNDNNSNITNSICRIEIDGKIMADNNNNNGNGDDQNHKLRTELEWAQKRIKKLEQQQMQLLQEKITIQSKHLLSSSSL